MTIGILSLHTELYIKQDVLACKFSLSYCICYGLSSCRHFCWTLFLEPSCCFLSRFKSQLFVFGQRFPFNSSAKSTSRFLDFHIATNIICCNYGCLQTMCSRTIFIIGCSQLLHKCHHTWTFQIMFHDIFLFGFIFIHCLVFQSSKQFFMQKETLKLPS